MRQQPGYPITGTGREVHNVFLSHAAELGIPGLLLWLAAFGGAVWRGFSRRWQRAPGPAVRGEVDPRTWRERSGLEGYQVLAGIPWNDLQVVDPPRG
jgi:hypothetical protein